MTALPNAITVKADRKLIGIYGEQVDVFAQDFAAMSRDGILTGNDYECYLHTAQDLAAITLHFTTPPEETQVDDLGTATLEFPTGAIVISEITAGAHGPFTLPDGPGIYQLHIFGAKSTRQETADRVDTIIRENPTVDAIRAALEPLDGREQYWINLRRTGDSTDDEEDD
ncbi:hypothetical protein [Amycolatopsis pigmentata]|uniref:Uncharacterized protein n=1 Tax=Amycolatopsis pigmentata TaxID=450801 RepID=A0ABW5G8B6_9PSEU